MILGGIHKVSLSDYPGKIAAVLFTQGCNLRCPICHNADLIDSHSKKTVSWRETLHYLASRKDRLDGIVLSGGEPFLQANILDAVAVINAMGYDVKIDTNGTFPGRLKELIAHRTVRYIAMDVKASREKYDEAAGTPVLFDNILASIQLIMESQIPYEFRTTLVPGFHDTRHIAAIADLIAGSDTFVLQNISGTPPLNPDFRQRIPFTKDQIIEMQKIAAPYVRSCVIRE